MVKSRPLPTPAPAPIPEVWSFYVIDLDAVRDDVNAALDSYPRRAWLSRELAMAAAEREIKEHLKMTGVIKSSREVAGVDWMGDRTGGRYCNVGEIAMFVYKIRIESTREKP